MFSHASVTEHVLCTCSITQTFLAIGHVAVPSHAIFLPYDPKIAPLCVQRVYILCNNTCICFRLFRAAVFFVSNSSHTTNNYNKKCSQNVHILCKHASQRFHATLHFVETVVFFRRQVSISGSECIMNLL